MANELMWVANTEKTLEANGGSLTNGSYVAANDADLLIADVDGYGWLQFEFSGAYGTAPTIGTVIDVYAKALNYETTNDNTDPQADFQHEYVCSIPLNDVTTTQYFKTRPVPNPYPLDDVTFFIANRAGQTLSAGWTLKVTPMTYKPT